MPWVILAGSGLLVLLAVILLRPRKPNRLSVETRSWDRRQRVLADPERTGVSREDPAFANVRVIEAHDTNETAAAQAAEPAVQPGTERAGRPAPGTHLGRELQPALWARREPGPGGGPRPTAPRLGNASPRPFVPPQGHPGIVPPPDDARRRTWSPTIEERWRKDPTMAAPTRTPEQRAAALEKAGAARRARAELLAAIRDGRESLPTVLDRAGDDDIVGRTKVLQLLRCLPGVGKARAQRLMAQAGIASGRKARGLGPRQRAALLDALDARRQ